MTFEDAIAAPGTKFQVTGSRVKDGKRTVMIYALDENGSKQLGFTHVPEAKHGAMVADLTTRGLAIAETDWYCGFIWVVNPESVTVYNSTQRVFWARENSATLADNTIIRRSEFVKVVSFAEDYVYRGVKVRLRSGEEAPLVTEAAFAPEGYSRNDLLMETGWAPTIAVAIANWAGADYQDLI